MDVDASGSKVEYEEMPPVRRATWPLVIALVVAFAVLAGIGFLVYRETTAKNEAMRQLAEATDRLEAADEIVIEVDEVVRARVEPSLGERAADAKDKLGEALGDLSSARSIIAAARNELPEEEVERADALDKSAEARQEMLEHAEGILDANIKAAAALGDANAGWDLVLEGEKIADAAVVEYNKLTKAAAIKSQDLSVQAERKLTDGRVKLESAEKAFPEAAIETFVDYVNQKLALIAISKQADAALIAGKNAQANQYSNQYNAKDKEVIALAKKLPDTPSAAIATAFENVAGKANQAYFQAREEATQADERLRDITE
ncbi:MAG: hypothetical protein ACYC6C_09910 [Coriobacteriia bacterium]